MATPHDKFFKAVFSSVEHARGELASVLPGAITQAIDWSSLTLLSGEHPEGATTLESDLLFRAQLEEEPVYLYLLFEHQSTVDRAMPFRLLRYMARIWERCVNDAPGQPLPVIIPLVLHHGERSWNAPTQFRALLQVPEQLAAAVAPYVPDFTFVLEDLSKLDDDALRGRQLTDLARVALLIMQRCRDSKDPAAILRPWAHTMNAVLAAPNGRDALRLVADYTAEVSDAEPEPIYRFFAELGPEAEEIFMSTADRLREQGRTLGLEQGLEQGVALTIMRLLTLKFGALPAEAQARIQAATPAQLERWTDRVLTASTLDEVLAK